MLVIRQQGIMIGIELVMDKESKKPYEPASRTGHKVIMEARKNGLMIRPLDDAIVIMPPLSILKQEIETICQVTYKAIKTVVKIRQFLLKNIPSCLFFCPSFLLRQQLHSWLCACCHALKTNKNFLRNLGIFFSGNRLR